MGKYIIRYYTGEVPDARADAPSSNTLEIASRQSPAEGNPTKSAGLTACMDSAENPGLETHGGGFCLCSQATALGRQCRGQVSHASPHNGGNPRKRLARLEATVVGFPDL
ncbi:hypothetical protein LC593_10075 [Nostoc sp. CHAB 5844]|nr:hypothetical protein [Nostoc sp. CHAB 5844]